MLVKFLRLTFRRMIREYSIKLKQRIPLGENFSHYAKAEVGGSNYAVLVTFRDVFLNTFKQFT